MTNPLRDYELKRDRAMQHFDVLRESVEEFTNVDHQPVPGEFDTDTGKYRFEAPLAEPRQRSRGCSRSMERRALVPTDIRSRPLQR